MSKVNRNKPARSKVSESRYTVFEFDREFPDDAACLGYLVAKLYPDGIHCPTCKKITKHHRETNRPSYACQYCGHHEHPLKGTIFEGSATSLKLWFYGIYLMASTRGGISAKQLERELGVTYKTAWRMFNKIRSLLNEEVTSLDGTVEIDDTFIGGKPRLGEIKKKADIRGWVEDSKVKVLGIAQRKGKVVAKVVPDLKITSVDPIVNARVLPATTVYTDEHRSYVHLGQSGYDHKRVHHSQKVYVDGDVHTQTIEGFWALLKGGLSGVYHGVSTKWLQSYLDEYTFRYNNRDVTFRRGMFDAFVSRIAKA